MNNFLVISMLLGFLIAQIILVIYNINYLNYFKRQEKAISISDRDSYYKLDAKIELQKYLAIGLITVGSLIGYSKLSDISNDLKTYEKLSNSYDKLTRDYESISKEYNSLKIKLDDLNQTYSNSRITLKDYDLELFKLNQKIIEASKRIPEDNLRQLAKLLVGSHLDNFASLGRITDKYHSEIEIIKEVKQTREILKYFGFSPNEIDNIIGNFEKENDWLFNKKEKNN